MNESPYVAIAENIDKRALRAPRSKSGDGFSEAFLEYLQLLYTPQEAEVAKHLNVVTEIFSIPFNPKQYMTATQLATVSGQPLQEVKKALKQMSDKNIMIAIRKVIKGTNITWPIRTLLCYGKSIKAKG